MGLFKSDTHIVLTEAALGYAGVCKTACGKKLRYEIVMRNVMTDVWYFFGLAHHAQSVEFVDLLEKHMQTIKNTQCGDCRCRISGILLEAIGQSTHILQDFYSHTDWIEGRNMKSIYELWGEPPEFITWGSGHDPHSETLDLSLIERGLRTQVGGLIYYEGGYNPIGNGSRHNRYAADGPRQGRDQRPPLGIPDSFEYARDRALQQTTEFFEWMRTNMHPTCRAHFFCGG